MRGATLRFGASEALRLTVRSCRVYWSIANTGAIDARRPDRVVLNSRVSAGAGSPHRARGSACLSDLFGGPKGQVTRADGGREPPRQGSRRLRRRSASASRAVSGRASAADVAHGHRRQGSGAGIGQLACSPSACRRPVTSASTLDACQARFGRPAPLGPPRPGYTLVRRALGEAQPQLADGRTLGWRAAISR